VLESSAVLCLCRAKIAKYLFSDHGHCGMSFDGLSGWDEAEDSIEEFQIWRLQQSGIMVELLDIAGTPLL
jgi:hypothetical protein